MFEYFFRLQGRPPQTIITDQQKTMELGLRQLAHNRIFSGVHIFDPFHVVNHIRNNLHGDEDSMRRAVRLVGRIIKARTLK
jgi:hypothetical protein